MQRRKFLSKAIKTGSAAAVLSQFPLFNIISKPLQKDKLGIALLGMGNYASNQLAPALKETENCYLSGIILGKYDDPSGMSEKFNVPDKNIYDYTDIEMITGNKDIDIVYVVLPNGLHAEYSIRAAEAGKHVICEKPMANNGQDSKRMIDVCNKLGKKLSIGYRLHFDPFHLKMMELGQKQVYGKVNEVEAGFAFTLKNENAWRLDKELSGGGPLMDVGIYALQGSIYTLGELPEKLIARDTTKDTAFFNKTGVEGSIEWDLHFPSGAVAKCRTSYEDHYNYLKANAEEGSFEIGPAYSYGGLKGSTPEGKMNLNPVNQQALQMDAFANCIRNNEQCIVPGEMGWRDMFIIDRIYESAATGKEVSLKGIPQILHRV